MIRRDILEDDAVLEDFDWFNDFEDTFRWLQGAQGTSGKYAPLLWRMRGLYDAWKVEALKEFHSGVRKPSREVTPEHVVGALLPEVQRRYPQGQTHYLLGIRASHTNLVGLHGAPTPARS